MGKKIVLGWLFAFALTSIVFAQSREEKRKEAFNNFRKKRITFITEKVKLTPKEAEVFWPLSNELQEKKFELNKPIREKRRTLRTAGQTLTETDYKFLIDTNIDIKLKEAQLEKDYLEKFKKILPAEKIYKYQRAEEEFMRQLFSPKNKPGDNRMEERKTTAK